MIKQLTLFCTFAIFMLAVGGAVTPLQAHCQDPPRPHSGDHPHCSEPLAFPVYDVVIDEGYVDADGGVILPGTGIGWVYDGKAVSSLNPRSDQLNISYFENKTSHDARKCFGTGIASTIPSWPEVTFGGMLRKQRKATAEGFFWFRGTTIDPNDGEVLYLLKIEGGFAEGPNGFPKNDEIMMMNKWTLKLENQGAAVTSRACVGEGEFAPPIDVLFIPPPEE